MKPCSCPPPGSLQPALGAPPPSYRSRLHDNAGCAAAFAGKGTRGRLEGCDIAGGVEGGVCVSGGADPVLATCR